MRNKFLIGNPWIKMLGRAKPALRKFAAGGEFYAALAASRRLAGPSISNPMEVTSLC